MSALLFLEIQNENKTKITNFRKIEFNNHKEV